MSLSGSICHRDIICLLGVSGALAVTLVGASAFYHSQSPGVGQRQWARVSRKGQDLSPKSLLCQAQDVSFRRD